MSAPLRTLTLAVLFVAAPASATGEDGETVDWTPLCVSYDRALFLEHRCFSPGVSGCTPRWSFILVDFVSLKLKPLPALPIAELVKRERLECGNYQPPSLLQKIPGLSVKGSAQGLVLETTWRPLKSSAVIPARAVRGALESLTCEESPERTGCWSLHRVIDADKVGEDGGVFGGGDFFLHPTARKLLVLKSGSGMQQVAVVSVAAQEAEDAAARVINDLGVELLRAGDPLQAAQLLENVRYPSAAAPSSGYNLACAYARLGLAAGAVGVLRGLPFSAGLVKKISRDADFNLIRRSPELVAFLAGPDAGQ